jgi:hypothetical protein
VICLSINAMTNSSKGLKLVNSQHDMLCFKWLV